MMLTKPCILKEPSKKTCTDFLSFSPEGWVFIVGVSRVKSGLQISRPSNKLKEKLIENISKLIKNLFALEKIIILHPPFYFIK